MSLFSSLLTRVLERAAPRPLSTEPGFQGGLERQISPAPFTQTRWHLSDLEGVITAADGGNMRPCGTLSRSLRRDGTISGVLSTRTNGLVHLPVQFKGDPEHVAALAHDFAQVFPTAELSMLVGDGILCGVGVGEFVQIAGALPVLRRLDPAFLQYVWSEDRWYFNGLRGREPVNPGDGRWVLHCPGGAVTPWVTGLWAALGRAFIAKEHAYFYRENYSGKLANSARVATSPAGATAADRQTWVEQVMRWGVNTVFGMPPGWGVSLVESNGRGFEVFQETITAADREIVVALAGQTVTTDGGAGFSNSDIHKSIRSDIIQSDANGLADTLNSQGIPVWKAERLALFDDSTRVLWDVSPPKDLSSEASAANQAAIASTAMNQLLAPDGKSVDMVEVTRRYGVPVKDGAAPATTAPTQDKAA